MMKSNRQNGYGIAVAIIVAGVLVAGAIFLVQGNEGNVSSGGIPNHAGNQAGGALRIPDETDHMRGNPDAAITIVEFSDLECPFCARLHPTLARITEENDDVKWVYRHFPLSTIHSRALSAAVASECVARHGGNDDFWNFVDSAFEDQRRLGNSWYREMASSFGIDAETFEGCMGDRSVVSDIQTDLDEAVGTGGRGTPHTVVITPKGQLMPFSGALPYEQVAALIEQARAN